MRIKLGTVLGTHLKFQKKEQLNYFTDCKNLSKIIKIKKKFLVYT